MRRSVLAFFLLSFPVAAHVVSMSTGELRVDGPLAQYELRMPMYEVAHVADPSKILDHIRFGDGHRVSASCAEQDGTYVCRASYEFPALVPNVLDVECTYFAITVPNHIHMLHAVNGPYSDQEVFDQSFPRGEIRFRPPSRFETISREFAGGAERAATSPAALMFLLAIAIAAVSRRTAFVMVAALLIGEIAAAFIGVRIPWPLGPRFLEAAAALTAAYVCVEILMMPGSKYLPLIVALLATFHGLHFAAFPAAYRAGAWTVHAVIFAVLAFICLRFAVGFQRGIAWALLVVALGLFALRLIR